MTSERFEKDGVTVASIAEAADWSVALERQWLSIMASGKANRPWVFWELHNPWSRAAVNVDSWQLLDICQSAGIIKWLAALIGDDIVLFDSQVVPNPALAEFDESDWRNDKQFFPLDDDGGVVVRLPFGSEQTRKFEYRRRTVQCVEYSIGQVLIHPADLDFRTDAVNGSNRLEYVIRYFPANRHFERDPAHPGHVQLTDRYPWVNYTQMPLWLVSGKDRASNDFATGFHTRTGRWTTARSR